MKFKNNLVLVSSIFLLVLSSCKHHKAIQQAKQEAKPIVVPAIFSLKDSLMVHRYSFNTLTAKVKTEFKGNDGTELNLMITLRAVSDSAIWMSASPALGIEAARILFTRDSIKILDRINGRYARESYSFLKRFTEADINYDMLQNILIGNAAFSSDSLPTDSITQYYFTHFRDRNLMQDLTVNKLFRIFENIITDQGTQDKIQVDYGDYQFVEKEFFPFHARIGAFSKGKTATIELIYTNVSVNAPVEIRFNIPSGYTKMNY